MPPSPLLSDDDLTTVLPSSRARGGVLRHTCDTCVTYTCGIHTCVCVCVCVWHTCMSHVCCSISLISETYTKVQEQSEALKLTHRARLILEVVVACDSAGICVCLSVRRRRRFGRPFARLVRSISRSRKVARESDSRAHARTVQSTPPPAVTLEGRRCIPRARLGGGPMSPSGVRNS